MKPIFGIPFAMLLTVAAPAAWAQPQFGFSQTAGAATHLSGGVYTPGVTVPDANGNLFDPCPPTVTTGLHGGLGTPPRETGGDGVRGTADASPLNTGGRTQMTYASADAGGQARAIVTNDTSSPCIVLPNGSIVMSANGLARAESYQSYEVIGNPRSSSIELEWALEGSFSQLTSSRGGHADVRIYLLADTTFSQFSLVVHHQINSRTGSTNFATCVSATCLPVPKASFVATRGRIDLRKAFQSATGRELVFGDSFLIFVSLITHTTACGVPDVLLFAGACNVLPAFTTDFGVSTRIRGDVEFTRQERP